MTKHWNTVSQATEERLKRDLEERIRRIETMMAHLPAARNQEEKDHHVRWQRWAREELSDLKRYRDSLMGIPRARDGLGESPIRSTTASLTPGLAPFTAAQVFGGATTLKQIK